MTSSSPRIRGSVLRSLINSGDLRLPKGVQVDDLETMLGLLLGARGILSESQLSEDEEKFALWSLCRWGWPVKPGGYASAAATLLSHFRGISNSPALQAKFRARISERYIRADAAKALAGTGVGIEKITDVLRRVRGQAIRARARAFKVEFCAAAQLNLTP
jgi:hypothetical protein